MRTSIKILTTTITCLLVSGCNADNHQQTSSKNVFEGLPNITSNADNCSDFKTLSIKTIEEEYKDTVFKVFKTIDCNGAASKDIELDSNARLVGVWNDHAIFYDVTALNYKTLFLVNLQKNEPYKTLTYEMETPRFTHNEIHYYESSEKPSTLEKCLDLGITEDAFEENLPYLGSAEKRIFNITTGEITKYPDDTICVFFQ